MHRDGLEKTRGWLSAGLIAVVAAGAYANSFRAAFQFDDFPAIVDNDTLRHLWPLSIPLCPPSGGLTVSGRPVLNLSFAVNYALSGEQPWSYHALNLLIHIGAALALFGIVRRTMDKLAAPHAYGSALAVALIWAVHPVTTEAVTYVAQRAESLMALFYLLTLYCFVRSVDELKAPSVSWGKRASFSLHGDGLGWKALAVIACWLGMATKEVMVSAPVAVFLYDRIFVAKSWTGVLSARRGFYAGMFASWILLIWLVAGTGWDRSGTFAIGASWLPFWLSQGEAIVRYCGLALWPYPLAFDYGPPTAPVALSVLLVALVLAALVATAIACFRGRPWAFLAGVCFLVLAPTSLLPGTLQYVAEHRMYLPLAAAVTAVVLGVQSVVSRWGVPERLQKPGVAFLLIMVVACLGTATVLRNRVYGDDLSLWMDTVAKWPRSALAEGNAGKCLLDRGRLAEGLACCKKAVELDPTKPLSRYNLGFAYEAESRWDEALSEFKVAARLNPKLFLAEFRVGRLLDRLGRPVEAEDFLRRALATEPGFAEAHCCLGVALAMQGRQVEAIDEFEHSLLLDANQPEVEFNLGISLAGLGRLDEAVTHYAAAVRLQTDYGEAQLNLGVTLAQLHRYADALPALQAAARLLPDSPKAHENLATILDQCGRTDASIAEYRTALKLNPGYAEAHYNLGNALIHAHDLVAARSEFSEALRLRPDFVAARNMLDRLAGLPSAP
jgi:tetratricopeptide (TPR) repeat protein